MSDSLIFAIGLVLIIEGVGPLLFPNRWRSYMQKLAGQNGSELRMLGGVMVVIGLMILWYLQ